MTDDYITLAHGAGGKQTSILIDHVFKAHFNNPAFTSDDAAILSINGSELAFTTDGFIVSPPEFPGGDIGKLSICGTVNDLTCMGAKPQYLSCAFVIEEGLPLTKLETYVMSMANTAAAAGIQIVAGDTKVAGKGQVDQLFITTTGIGILDQNSHPAGNRAIVGDSIILTGDIGRHGCTILLARNSYGMEADITSDCAPLWNMMSPLYKKGLDIHVVRDATRGGVGTVLYEIAQQSHAGIEIEARKIPVLPAVSGVCSMLGLDPLYLACEGRMVIIAAAEDTPSILDMLHSTEDGKDAALIGHIIDDMPGRVIVQTEIGTKTLLPQPTGELLPRIC